MEKIIFDKKNRAIAFVYLEVIILLVLLWQMYHFLGVKYISGEFLFFQNIINVEEVYLFFVNLAVFILIYFKIALKDKNVLKIHEDFSKIVLGKAKEKIFGIERKIIVFIILQFVFAFIIAIAIAFYLDPEIEFPGFSQVPFPLNIIAFLAFLFFGFYLFAKTKPFRDQVYDEGFLQKKLIPAQRLFPVKRITNKKTGSVRIKNKK